MRSQEEFVMRLVRENARTAFGQKMGVNTIFSLQEFRKHIPLSSYEDYSDYIERIAKGEKKNTIGFGQAFEEKKEQTLSEKLRGLTPQDLMKFGLTPEFVGRLPVLVALDELNEEAMVKILTEPKNALVKQYQKLLQLDGVELEFEEEALREIAQTAMRKNTGARGLRAIMENVMEDIMFDMPDEENVKKCIVTKAAVLGEEMPVIVRDNKKKPA
jgi:ATP-dependent Clp protease ATP-binding subunit ClpX